MWLHDREQLSVVVMHTECDMHVAIIATVVGGDSRSLHSRLGRGLVARLHDRKQLLG